MFPSIVAGGTGVVVAKPLGAETCSYKSTVSFKPRKEIDARNSVLKHYNDSSPAPTLPRISREGSFTSMVSSRSTKSNWREKRNKLKGRQEENPEKGFPDLSGFTAQNPLSITTTELELDCKARNMECGFPVHVQNPRFSVNGWASTARPHFPQTRNAQMMQMAPPSTIASQRITRNTSKVTYLRGKWQVRNAKNPRTEFVGVTEQATLNARYKVPLIRTAPDHKNKPQHTQARDVVTTTTSHRRCSCHRHGEDSSEEIRRPQSIWERLAGTPQTSSDNLFKTDARLRPTESSTLKRQQVHSKGITTNLRKKTKKITCLASDSTSSTLDKRKNKRGIQSTRSKSDIQIRQKTIDAPTNTVKKVLVEAVPHGHAHSAQPDEQMEVDDVKSERSGQGQVFHESVERLHEHLEIETIAGSVLSSSPHSLQRALTPRLLQVNPDQLKGSKDASALAKEFQKLDCDCDGHLSFKELTKSLPQDLSKKQTAYIKKIYDRACESTFFGLEEFMAAHQLCYFVKHASPALSDAYSKLDFVGIESWLQIYMELFSGYDKTHKGVISVESLQKLLVAARTDNEADLSDIRTILNTMKKGPSDSVSGVEVLAYIPYFVAAFPSEASRIV